MSQLRHYYGLNHLQFITTITYRRARLFDSIRLKQNFALIADIKKAYVCAPASLPSRART